MDYWEISPVIGPGVGLLVMVSWGMAFSRITKDSANKTYNQDLLQG